MKLPPPEDEFPGATPVRVLTTEEIAAIAHTITPVSEIPEYHMRGRVSQPNFRKSTYRIGLTTGNTL